jgi:predicted phosphoribosyltransferase
MDHTRYALHVRYRNREEAGMRLADALEGVHLVDRETKPLVLGIPRGGIPVAAVIADRIGGELDVLVAHKLGAPGNPEYAIGAVAEDGTAIVDEKTVGRLGIPPEYVEDEKQRQQLEVVRRAETLRGGGGPTSMSGRVCVVVDDGVATGATLEASLRLVVRADPNQLVAAIPVGPPDTIRRLASIVDVVVCPLQPAAFLAVGAWYDDFGQVSERTVIELLKRR